ncbi:hypothetical protein [Kribbella shirazensis]|uniref:Uncharacterized protein n=1 Tax=Kribbella shirazensis TaxID=1105143 RepID=A0A7X5VJ18_9ACTN|nr:hypothetical protein [Kribbella shirazensis]NIK62186.1 hypothetical protein [Kribbella shirazensis]
MALRTRRSANSEIPDLDNGLWERVRDAVAAESGSPASVWNGQLHYTDDPAIRGSASGDGTVRLNRTLVVGPLQEMYATRGQPATQQQWSERRNALKTAIHEFDHLAGPAGFDTNRWTADLQPLEYRPLEEGVTEAWSQARVDAIADRALPPDLAAKVKAVRAPHSYPAYEPAARAFADQIGAEANLSGDEVLRRMASQPPMSKGRAVADVLFDSSDLPNIVPANEQEGVRQRLAEQIDRDFADLRSLSGSTASNLRSISRGRGLDIADSVTATIRATETQYRNQLALQQTQQLQQTATREQPTLQFPRVNPQQHLDPQQPQIQSPQPQPARPQGEAQPQPQAQPQPVQPQAQPTQPQQQQPQYQQRAQPQHQQPGQQQPQYSQQPPPAYPPPQPYQQPGQQTPWQQSPGQPQQPAQPQYSPPPLQPRYQQPGQQPPTSPQQPPTYPQHQPYQQPQYQQPAQPQHPPHQQQPQYQQPGQQAPWQQSPGQPQQPAQPQYPPPPPQYQQPGQQQTPWQQQPAQPQYQQRGQQAPWQQSPGQPQQPAQPQYQQPGQQPQYSQQQPSIYAHPPHVQQQPQSAQPQHAPGQQPQYQQGSAGQQQQAQPAQGRWWQQVQAGPSAQPQPQPQPPQYQQPQYQQPGHQQHQQAGHGQVGGQQVQGDGQWWRQVPGGPVARGQQQSGRGGGEARDADVAALRSVLDHQAPAAGATRVPRGQAATGRRGGAHTPAQSANRTTDTPSL